MTPPPDRIRPIAIGIFRRGDSILVELGQDPATGEHFCRPPGGEIEFGEDGAAACTGALSAGPVDVH